MIVFGDDFDDLRAATFLVDSLKGLENLLFCPTETAGFRSTRVDDPSGRKKEHGSTHWCGYLLVSELRAPAFEV